MRKYIVLLLVSIIFLCFLEIPAFAATWYDIRTYNASGVQTGYYIGNSNPNDSYYYVVTVMDDTARAGYSGSTKYKAKAAESSGLPVRTRIRYQNFDPRLASNYLGDAYSNKNVLVSECQRALFYLGYDPGPIDGYWGPKTKQAVKTFQTRNGLGSDGIVGRNTWELLASIGKGPNTLAMKKSVMDTTSGFLLEDNMDWEIVVNLAKETSYEKDEFIQVLINNGYEIHKAYVPGIPTTKIVGFELLSKNSVKVILSDETNK